MDAYLRPAMSHANSSSSRALALAVSSPLVRSRARSLYIAAGESISISCSTKLRHRTHLREHDLPRPLSTPLLARMPRTAKAQNVQGAATRRGQDRTVLSKLRVACLAKTPGSQVARTRT